MTGAELLALAERVEAAGGPDRGLDGTIALLQGFRVVEEGHPLGQCCYDTDGRLVVLPRYTASLDAAMTLVGDDFWRVEDHALAGPCALVGDQEGYAVTPALALCAASLKARAATAPSSCSADNICPMCGALPIDQASEGELTRDDIKRIVMLLAEGADFTTSCDMRLYDALITWMSS